MKGRISTWLAGSVVGAAVLALPDEGPRVFSFSETHGPSAVDLVGMLVLVAAWVPVAVLIWSERASLRGGWGRGAAVLGVAGTVVLVMAISLDLGGWWIGAVPALVVAQLMALHAASCAQNHRASSL